VVKGTSSITDQVDLDGGQDRLLPHMGPPADDLVPAERL
jgi:hypothetical protein